MLNVSLSPHVHSGNTTQKCMLQVIVALLPALAWSVYQFGSGALIVTLSSVAFCVLFEFLITRFLMKSPKTSLDDLSAVVTGLLLAFNLPSNIDLWIIAIGALVAIGVGKMAFGGLGTNIFNPALVGRVFLLIAYPVQMTTWPTEAGYADVATGATPLALIGQYINGANVEVPAIVDCLVGSTGGSLGEVSAIALLIGGVYLLIRKTITWHIPVAVLVSAFVFGWLFYGFDFTIAVDELLCGGMMLGAIYMATDYVSSPMNPRSQLIYGVCIGFLAILIRRFGAYPEGMSFAILIMNAFTPLLNKYVKPQRFGVVKK